MKHLLLILACMTMFISGNSEKTVPAPNAIDNAVDFWKAHAYVQLKLMDYRVSKIIETE